MQEAIEHPTHLSEGAGVLADAALRAERWAGEPFLRPDEDPAEALAPGRARRRALDDALAEMEARPADALDRVEDPLRAHARARARDQPTTRRAWPRAPSCGGTRSTRSPGCSPS